MTKQAKLNVKSNAPNQIFIINNQNLSVLLLTLCNDDVHCNERRFLDLVKQ